MPITSASWWSFEVLAFAVIARDAGPRLFWKQDYCRERRQRQHDRLLIAVIRDLLHADAVEGSISASPPPDIVARNRLRVSARARDTDAVVVARDGGHVQHYNRVLVTVAARVRHDGFVAVRDVDPREPLPAGILPPELRILAIHLRERAHELVERRAPWIVAQQMPIEARLVVPLGVRRQLGAHEEQLLAGAGEHVREQETQVRELLPLVARHL